MASGERALPVTGLGFTELKVSPRLKESLIDPMRPTFASNIKKNSGARFFPALGRNPVSVLFRSGR